MVVTLSRRQSTLNDAASEVDLRILLLAGPEGDPTTRAWKTELQRLGVDHHVQRPAGDKPLEIADLVDGPLHGRYNAIVLGTDSSAFWSSLPCLREYRRRYSVRQLDAFEFPRPSVGLQDPYGRAMVDETASLTQTGRAHFGYLTGRIPIEAGSFGYLTRHLDERTFTSYVETADGAPLVGVYSADDGLEEMVVTVNYDEPMLHFRLLARGLLSWVTRGCHLGMGRGYLSVHVDDVFLPNSTVADTELTGDPATAGTVRMTGHDVEAVLDWQEQHGLTLDLAFNAYGADPAGVDPLTRTLLQHRDRFRWVNHTWSHLDLGWTPTPADATPSGLDVMAICEEIERNRSWAISAGVPVSSTALVTGAHSGLDNPNLSTALQRSGVTAIATDASRPVAQEAIGAATAVPRHPTNVYTHVSTWPELLRSYNKHYDGVAERAETPQDFLDSENRIVLRRLLSNDARPLFAHQSNLTHDRLLLCLLEHALALYRGYVATNAPLLNPSMDEVAEELRRRRRWDTARHARLVSARCSGKEAVLTSQVDVEVPLTLPARSGMTRRWLRRIPFGTAYAGSVSAWQPLRAGMPLSVALPARRQRVP